MSHRAGVFGTAAVPQKPSKLYDGFFIRSARAVFWPGISVRGPKRNVQRAQVFAGAQRIFDLRADKIDRSVTKMIRTSHKRRQITHAQHMVLRPSVGNATLGGR
jgi:hypothetical protein